MKARLGVAIVTACTALGLLAAAPAQASIVVRPSLAPTIVGAPVTATHTQLIQESSGPVIITLTTTSQQVSTSTRGVPRIEVASSGCVAPVNRWWIQTWSETAHSALWGIAWSETQSGRYFYNGCNAWQDTRSAYPSANNGYHSCGNSRGIGFSIEVEGCYKYGDPSPSLELGDQFKVSAAFRGFPVSDTHNMAECANGSGGWYSCVFN